MNGRPVRTVRDGSDRPPKPKGAHIKGQMGPRADQPPVRTVEQPSGKGGKGKRGRKVKVILIVLAIVLAALGATWVVLSHTDLFKIEEVHVEGSKRLTDEYLTGLIDVTEGTNLLNVDTGAITERLSANPWIESASVHRDFPHTLVIEIVDADPGAVIQIDPSSALGTTQYWLISKDGIWMSQVSSTGVEEARQLVIDATDDSSGEDEVPVEPVVVWTDEDGVGYDADGVAVSFPEGYQGDAAVQDEAAAQDGAEAAGQDVAERAPSVTVDVYMTVEDLSTVPIVSGTAAGIIPEVGMQETDEGILNALGILTSASDEFKSQIATVTASSDDSTNIMLKNGVEVAFGTATDIETKIQIVNDLLEQYAGEIAYINVRVPARPAWRGL